MFTEEDFEDEALIKEEIGPKLQSLMTRKYPQIMQYYGVVCEDVGRKTGDDLADLLIRVLNDPDGMGQVILNTEINLRQAKINSIRTEDLEFVMELSQKFIDQDTDSKVDEFIETYMGKIAGSAGSGGIHLTDKRRESEYDDASKTLDEIRRERQKMENELVKLRKERQKLEKLRGESPTDSDDGTRGKSSEERRDDINSLFDTEAGETENVDTSNEDSEIPLSSDRGVDDDE